MQSRSLVCLSCCEVLLKACPPGLDSCPFGIPLAVISPSWLPSTGPPFNAATLPPLLTSSPLCEDAQSHQSPPHKRHCPRQWQTHSMTCWWRAASFSSPFPTVSCRPVLSAPAIIGPVSPNSKYPVCNPDYDLSDQLPRRSPSILEAYARAQNGAATEGNETLREKATFVVKWIAREAAGSAEWLTRREVMCPTPKRLNRPLIRSKLLSTAWTRGSRAKENPRKSTGTRSWL